MTIYEQIKFLLKDRLNEVVTSEEIKAQLKTDFGTNPDSVILSDYCYNRYNHGINFDKHLFHYINRSTYRYLGENYSYTGIIYHKPKKQPEMPIGEWNDGEKVLYSKPSPTEESKDIKALDKLSVNQLHNLFEKYNEILKYEMTVLECKPTELRHLIGRSGEILSALQTGGILAKETNQHGFDVLQDGKRISVKTTAQTSGFVSININTFDQFDELHVIQYINDDFSTIYYGAKEPIKKISRIYEHKYEVDISKLKALHLLGNQGM